MCTEEDTEYYTCPICGGPLPERRNAYCYVCGGIIIAPITHYKS